MIRNKETDMRLAGSNLDGSAKIKPDPTKEMTAAEIVELKKLLDCPFYRRAFKGVR
jgi:hypothetical protein